MIGTLIGLAGGLASSIIGGSQQAKAARKQQHQIEQQRAREDAWYNRNYYENYVNSAEAQAAIKRVEDTLRRRNQQAQAQAAITGATPEQALAQQANDQQMMGDVVSNLAARGDARRRDVDAQHQARMAGIEAQQAQQYALNEQGGAQLMANGGSLIGSALSLIEGNKKPKTT